MPKSKSLSINYDENDFDLKESIGRLKNSKGSRFEGRSMSQIALMILEDALPREIKKLEREAERKRANG